ncbi:MAG: excinuclease ABC subunit UvrA [Nitrospirae bacterium]|uniref:excinuclease ABC subunit UvrA n=1 Tax=Candidatus Magnetobacterium casense TaxID=1455061 RepID=UPI00058E30EF|nr:excinuclease ABC subunit UvrA [Candidatus Magnetobacterium casensis]MBF0337520.1 excinuclease ABC subunit UvrA [Nitrospirota bacterium]
MDIDWLEIKGVRQNNLGNITLRVPHNKVIAITGVSGSGKSSLAFDTIFAEGQWRFIESLSSYAKLFLEKLNRPDVDEIRNIRPAIALEQRNPVKGSRSTVGTVTEIYDLMRVMFARISTPFCPKCGQEIRKWTPSVVVRQLVEKHATARAIITYSTQLPLATIREQGFVRLYVAGQICDIFDVTEDNGTYEVVVDRVVIRDEPRLADSVELAWRYGNGRMKVIIYDGGETIFSQGNACERCNITMPEATPILFSFNHPVGACPECKGFGNILRYDEALIVPNAGLSLSQGAIEPWEKPAFKWWKTQLLTGIEGCGIDPDAPFHSLTPEQKKTLYDGVNGRFYGINEFFEVLESKRYQLHIRVFLSYYRMPLQCPSCLGKKLKQECLAYRIGGFDIADLNDITIDRLYEFFNAPVISDHQREVVEEILRHIRAKLELLMRVGLDYLTLNRQTMTLSGGEFQRINLVNQLSSRLAGTLYVLDEPTVGLHSSDNERIARIINELANQGNTIIVVEHDPEIIGASDWVVELGPGGGKNGGQLVFNGTIDDFLKADTITARYMHGVSAVVPHVRSVSVGQSIRLRGASGHNLKGVDLTIPLGALTVVSGVSGSGKSTLVVETLYRALARHLSVSGVPHRTVDNPLPYEGIDGAGYLRDACLIDQSPIGRNPRSNPATYIKLFEHIRRLFAQQPEARAHGYEAGYFSFNIPGGRCETCKGEGYQKLAMYFFEDLYVKCQDCNGSRYAPDALNVRYNGRTISQCLQLTVEEAIEFFDRHAAITKKLVLLRDIGLGYIQLGQAATTLSGGEAQRLKICAELGVQVKTGVMYILDEPTIGLHMHDVGALVGILRRLVEVGNTVVIIEHNLDVIALADHCVELGPDAGDKGGRIVFEGTPLELSWQEGCHTGRGLARRLG